MSENGMLQRFDTLAGYRAGMLSLMTNAHKQLCFCERTLQESEFATRAYAEMMEQFLAASPTASIRILVLDPEFLVQRCPRLLTLKQRFSQRMAMRVAVEMPTGWSQGFVLADDVFYLKRHHWDWMRGEYGEGRREFVVLSQVFEQVWEQALPPAGIEQLML